MYSAGGMCGKNAAVGGWFNTFPIPFSKSILVLARNSQKGCTGGYINVRGTEGMPVVVPGSGIPLPSTARLTLQKNDWAIHQPNTFVNVSSFPAGTKGLHFQTTWAVELQPKGGSGAGGAYIEGCWHFYRQHNEPYPGLVIGTGVEDYFDSGYYFGGDTFLHKGLLFQNQLAGLTYFERTTDDYERISAYRFHANDPLVFNDGGGVVWQVGCGKPPLNAQDQHRKNATRDTDSATAGGMTKCGNAVPQATGPLPAQLPFPPPPPASPSPPKPPAPAPAPVEEKGGPGLGREAEPIALTTYGWVYTWP